MKGMSLDVVEAFLDRREGGGWGKKRGGEGGERWLREGRGGRWGGSGGQNRMVECIVVCIIQ